MTITTENPERITIIAPSFSEAAIEFHRSNMAERGYQMDGPITPRQFMVAENAQRPQDMFEGKPMFAATFVQVGAEAQH